MTSVFFGIPCISLGIRKMTPSTSYGSIEKAYNALPATAETKYTYCGCVGCGYPRTLCVCRGFSCMRRHILHLPHYVHASKDFPADSRMHVGISKQASWSEFSGQSLTCMDAQNRRFRRLTQNAVQPKCGSAVLGNVNPFRQCSSTALNSPCS